MVNTHNLSATQNVKETGVVKIICHVGFVYSEAERFFTHLSRNAIEGKY